MSIWQNLLMEGGIVCCKIFVFTLDVTELFNLIYVLAPSWLLHSYRKGELCQNPSGTFLYSSESWIFWGF